VIWAPFWPEIPFGYCSQSICGQERISSSSTIAKCCVIFSPPPRRFVSVLPRTASSRVISPKRSAPSSVNCSVTIGCPPPPVLVSKSCRVPSSLRCSPVICGIGRSTSSGW
jgi:hypothetical protein